MASDSSCCVAFLASLVLVCTGVSVWLVTIHQQVTEKVDQILSAIHDDRCHDTAEENVAYTNTHALYQLENIHTQEICDARCRQEPQCNVWSWAPNDDIDESPTGSCFLRFLPHGQSPQKRQQQGLVSGRLCHSNTRKVMDSGRLRQPTQLVATTRDQLRGNSTTRFGEAGQHSSRAVSLRSTSRESTSTSSVAPLATTLTSTSTSSRVSGETLFCFSVMLPESYEESLMRLQWEMKISIFACDGYSVYSSRVIKLADGLQTAVVNSDLKCDMGGEFWTAMNTPIFREVWRKVGEDALYMHFSWTVKVDPDSVFFPARLRPQLAVHKENNIYRLAGQDARGAGMDRLSCDVWGGVGDGSCRDPPEMAVQAMGECMEECDKYENCRGISFREEADVSGCILLGRVNKDAGVERGWQLTRKEREGVYINNCQFGLHGPLEIFSNGAVTALVSGWEHCRVTLDKGCGGKCAWGEDLFIDQCLWKVLGIRRDDMTELLYEDHCEPPEGWVDCKDTSRVAFHPFKNVAGYLACFDRSSALPV